MRRIAPLRQRINSLVASTRATATASSDTANALSSCAQIKIRPMTKVTPSVLRAWFAQRRRASTVRLWFLETARTRMARKIRTTARSTSDFSPSRIRVLSDEVSQSIIVATPLSSLRTPVQYGDRGGSSLRRPPRSEEHTSELQSLTNLVCRLLLEKKKTKQYTIICT